MVVAQQWNARCLLANGQEFKQFMVDMPAKPVISVSCNPCQILDLEVLNRMEGQDRNKVMWCGDFKAHNTLLGGRGKRMDGNGQVMENLMEIKDLVCLNDGRGTRIDVATGKESALDLTGNYCSTMAGICEWEVWEELTVGSDHYPIVCTVGRWEEVSVNGVGRCLIGRAKWDQFQELSEQVMARVDMRRDVDSMNNWVRTAVQWWTEDCF
jgi:hypothetical protein